MDYVFKKHTYNSIREQADQVRLLHSKSNKLPVDIDSIIEFGYKIKLRPIQGLKSQHDVEGFLSQDRTVIFIDSESFMDPRFDSRVRFTLAHELGHYILHKDFYEKVTFKTPEDWIKVRTSLDEEDIMWYERHANEFAGRLLVPYDALLNDIKSLKEIIKNALDSANRSGLSQEDIDDRMKYFIAGKICKKYGVSSDTIVRRLRSEKIDY